MDVSIVTQTVTVRHSQHLYPEVIKAALDDAGFDIVTTPAVLEHKHSFTGSISRLQPTLSRKRLKHIQQCPQCQSEQEHTTACDDARDKLGENTLLPYSPDTKNPNAASSSSLSKERDSYSSPVVPSEPALPSAYHVTLSVGGMTCASCSNTLTRIVSELPGVSEVVINLLANSASATVNSEDRVQAIVDAIEDAGYDADVVSVDPVKATAPKRRELPREAADGPFRLSLSVGGMTCASCTNTVTSIASDIPGVSDVVVNLIGKSATAIIAKKELADQLVEAIEDAGYEAEVVTLEPLDQSPHVVGPRTVSLRVEGMFCPYVPHHFTHKYMHLTQHFSHCPQKVMALLRPLQDRVTIDKPLTSYTDPIIRLSYTPSPPEFTLRTIIGCINAPSSSPSHPFTASIFHPPTLEERARYMQAREQRALLWRLGFSVVVAIPTFIIGVVYMSLVPSSDATRMWWMRPMWAGNVSRLVWALFFLATPVMFYSAGIFHRRSLKEIWALWKRGSRVPVWKRFVRFGSMNMLVSSGVAVAYFASIALLALAAAQPPSPAGEGDSTTYFDSVVLLTMFLLAGESSTRHSRSAPIKRHLQGDSWKHTARGIPRTRSQPWGSSDPLLPFSYLRLHSAIAAGPLMRRPA